MLAILPVLLLLVIPLVLLFIRLLRPRANYSWLIAAGALLLAWPMVLLARLSLPFQLQMVTWQPANLFHASPALRVDSLSWPFALALISLCLAVLLTDLMRAVQGERPVESNWLTWASSLAITALGLWAVQADNPLTLLLAWGAMDIFELLILLEQGALRSEGERIITAFSGRVAGLVLVIWAGIVAESAGGSSLVFSEIPPQAAPYLLLAAVLRLGVLPLRLAFFSEVPLRRGLGTLLRLAPVAAALTLAARVAASGGFPLGATLPLLLLAGLGLYAGYIWLRSQDEVAGRPAWVLGASVLALASALLGQPLACQAWALAGLLPGGLLFLYSARRRSLWVLLLLGLLGITALPYTPAWNGVLLYAGLDWLVYWPVLLFLIVHVLLLAGWVRHALRLATWPPTAERWVWVIYPAGLALLPLAHWISAVWNPSAERPGLVLSWPAFATFGLLGLMLLVRRRLRPYPAWQRLVQEARLIPSRGPSYAWLYPLVWGVYRSLRRVTNFINRILEGEGGILWTILLLTLLLAYLSQSTGAGEPGLGLGN